MAGMFQGRCSALICALLSMFGASACGGSVESEGSPVPIAQFASEYASSLCKTYAGCCEQAGLPYNYANCFDGYTSQENFTSTVVSEGYDPTLGRRCIDTVARSASSCLLGGLGSAEVLEVCSPLFPKPRTIIEATGAILAAQGEACDETCTNYDCRGKDGSRPLHACSLEEGLRCAEDRTCQPALELGEACDNLHNRCLKQLTCVAGQCIEQHANGPCANNSACISTSTCQAGQCVPSTIVSAEFCAGE